MIPEGALVPYGEVQRWKRRFIVSAVLNIAAAIVVGLAYFACGSWFTVGS